MRKSRARSATKRWHCRASRLPNVRGLSIEVQQKLNQHKPETIGQASRISGISSGRDLAPARSPKRGIGAPERSAAMDDAGAGLSAQAELGRRLEKGAAELGLALGRDVRNKLLQ